MVEDEPASAQRPRSGAGIHVAGKPVVNLFAAPSGDVEVTSQAIYGAHVELLETTGAWAKVRTSDGYEGFVRRVDLVEWTPAPGAHQARAVQLSANIYRDPEVKSRAPLLNIPWEARLEVMSLRGVGEDKRWVPVRLLDGAPGFVQLGDIAFDGAACGLADMLELAQRFLGITYTWGGTSSYGFDCSGFVQMLFRQAGVGIPRDAQAQSEWTGFTPVGRDALQPADVLFFGESEREITHVGLCLGNGRFIHDTTHGHPCIQISRLDEAPWNERLIAQRRLRP